MPEVRKESKRHSKTSSLTSVKRRRVILGLAFAIIAVAMLLFTGLWSISSGNFTSVRSGGMVVPVGTPHIIKEPAPIRSTTSTAPASSPTVSSPATTTSHAPGAHAETQSPVHTTRRHKPTHPTPSGSSPSHSPTQVAPPTSSHPPITKTPGETPSYSNTGTASPPEPSPIYTSKMPSPSQSGQ